MEDRQGSCRARVSALILTRVFVLSQTWNCVGLRNASRVTVTVCRGSIAFRTIERLSYRRTIVSDRFLPSKSLLASVGFHGFVGILQYFHWNFVISFVTSLQKKRKRIKNTSQVSLSQDFRRRDSKVGKGR